VWKGLLRHHPSVTHFVRATSPSQVDREDLAQALLPEHALEDAVHGLEVVIQVEPLLEFLR
jgi:hypothetical protein